MTKTMQYTDKFIDYLLAVQERYLTDYTEFITCKASIDKSDFNYVQGSYKDVLLGITKCLSKPEKSELKTLRDLLRKHDDALNSVRERFEFDIAKFKQDLDSKIHIMTSTKRDIEQFDSITNNADKPCIREYVAAYDPDDGYYDSDGQYHEYMDPIEAKLMIQAYDRAHGFIY